MKLTHPNHSESRILRMGKALVRIADRTASTIGWAIVILISISIIALLIRITWFFVILALRAIGEI